ncbi:hypothetical protein EXT46_10355 [Pseudoalteromonas sp. CO325X]|uniref:tetratricopeptide repeat protein n=1 Tax=Pseudoalteromonas sp. CO325X TaxID=1777262 RepID=UPI001023701D|nr:tetratricopeptide repeat protein [Pseudoalteromonas sp. CO325X]RZF80968.1 hypothetical protein EXT46_10355 [Pseudoalteromonas sp. CO325X]
MSLLNKALKDIEQRDGKHELALEPTVQLPQARPWRNVITIVAVLVSAMVVIALAYLLIPAAPKSTSDSFEEATVAGPSHQANAPTLVIEETASQPKQTNSVALTAPKDDNSRPVSAINAELNSPQHANVVENEQTEPPTSSQQLPSSTKPVEAAQAMVTSTTEDEPSDKPLATQPKAPQVEPPTRATNASQPVASSSDTAVKVVKALSVQQRAQRWFEQGQQSLRFAMTNEAIKQFEQAVILVPEHEQARSSLAATLYGQQRLEEAYSVLINGLKVAPETLSWRVMIAKMAIEQQQYQRVLEVLGDGQNARTTQLGNNDYWILKGSAARQLKQHDIAKVCFTELVRRQPNVAKWWLALATSEDALGQYHSARGHYATALQLGGLSGPSQQYALARYDSLQDTP